MGLHRCRIDSDGDCGIPFVGEGEADAAVAAGALRGPVGWGLHLVPVLVAWTQSGQWSVLYHLDSW